MNLYQNTILAMLITDRPSVHFINLIRIGLFQSTLSIVVQFGLLQSTLVQLCPFGLLRSIQDCSGPRMTKFDWMDKISPKWIDYDRIRPKWIEWTELNIMDQIGPKFTELNTVDQSGLNRTEQRPNGLNKTKRTKVDRIRANSPTRTELNIMDRDELIGLNGPK